MRFFLLAFALFCAAPVAAQTAIPCGWQARADAIVEPWAENTTTFANGALRVALLDTIEPAASAAYLLITHPPVDEVGLTFTVPAIIYLPEQSFQNSALLSIAVNQSTGDVIVTQALGDE